MTIQLSKAQIDALKCELAKYGLNVTVSRRPKQAETPKDVKAVLAKSKWYKPPSLSTRLIVTTARNLSAHQWEAMRENPAKYGICFPYKEI